MSEPTILAVDLGTSGMKVALITVSGRVLGWESEPVRLIITPDGGAKDVFVHISAVQSSGLNGLSDGQKVTFDTEPDKRGKGPKAVNLQLA